MHKNFGYSFFVGVTLLLVLIVAIAFPAFYFTDNALFGKVATLEAYASEKAVATATLPFGTAIPSTRPAPVVWTTYSEMNSCDGYSLESGGSLIDCYDGLPKMRGIVGYSGLQQPPYEGITFYVDETLGEGLDCWVFVGIDGNSRTSIANFECHVRDNESIKLKRPLGDYVYEGEATITPTLNSPALTATALAPTISP